MAVRKISELPAASAVTADDIVPVVDDPGGATPTTKKATLTQLRGGITDLSDVAYDPADLSLGDTLRYDPTQAAWAPWPTVGGQVSWNDPAGQIFDDAPVNPATTLVGTGFDMPANGRLRFTAVLDPDGDNGGPYDLTDQPIDVQASLFGEVIGNGLSGTVDVVHYNSSDVERGRVTIPWSARTDSFIPVTVPTIVGMTTGDYLQVEVTGDPIVVSTLIIKGVMY
ncbi:MAG: hypothetical protein ACF8PN_08130 [Phycisphaerales bacterium]